jgi:hypothetical protein
MTTQLQKHEDGGAVAKPQQSMDIESLCRMAVEKGQEGVAVLERLMVIRRELNAEQAKAAYNSALAAFQEECPPLPKGKTVKNDQHVTLYSYCPFETILALVRPKMREYGLSFTLDTDTESKDGWVIATCKITHTSGHSEVSRAKFPLGAGTRAMSQTQVFAAALSFASRRVFCNALGLVTVGEDFDGGDQRPKQPSPIRKPAQEQPAVAEPSKDAKTLRERLWAILEPVRGENWESAKAWLVTQKIIPAGQMIGKLTPSELTVAIEKSEIVLSGE